MNAPQAPLLQHSPTYCNTLQHAATHCNTLHHGTTHCSTPQHAATHSNTQQHTATQTHAHENYPQAPRGVVVWTSGLKIVRVAPVAYLCGVW